jgi:hypothetical protein
VHACRGSHSDIGQLFKKKLYFFKGLDEPGLIKNKWRIKHPSLQAQAALPTTA